MSKLAPFSLYLAGAPGSGKTALVEKLREVLDGRTDLPEIEILDGYSKAVESVGIPLGGTSSYMTTMALHGQHLVDEMNLKSAGKNFITCGGLLERMAHSGVKVEVLNHQLKTVENDNRIMREMQMATILSFLVVDTFDYALTFYLPLPPSNTTPDKRSGEEAYNERVDLAIKTVLSNFRIPVIVLEGDVDNQVTKMIDSIEEMLKVYNESEEQERTHDSSTNTTGDGESKVQDSPLLHESADSTA